MSGKVERGARGRGGSRGDGTPGNVDRFPLNAQPPVEVLSA